MRQHALPPELDRPARRRPAHEPPPPGGEVDRVLSLQSAAGNAAVTAALAGPGPGLAAIPTLQRQPKKKAKAVPQYVKDAQAELTSLFPKTSVKIKDYADLNKVLTSTSTFTAWTQSATDIYIKDMGVYADPSIKDRDKMMLRYVLKHEAVHIGQFAKDKGPPKTWEKMLEYERDAYGQDLAWLGGSQGAALISDPTVLKEVTDSARAALNSVNAVLATAQKLTGAKREEKLYNEMKAADLIPSTATKDPRDLYKQPP